MTVEQLALSSVTLDDDVADSRRAKTSGKARQHPLVAYRRLCGLVDVVAVVAAVGISYLLRFGVVDGLETSRPTYAATAVLLVATWLALLANLGAYEMRSLGSGAYEYKRVLSASALSYAAIACFSFFAKSDVSRAFLLVTIPLGAGALLLGRRVSRAWLRSQRARGRGTFRTMLVEAEDVDQALIAALQSDFDAGFAIVGSVHEPLDEHLDVWIRHLVDRVKTESVDALVFSGSSDRTPELIRRLAWSSELERVDMLVKPGFDHVVGPRLTIRPAVGLPLLHLDEPQLTGPRRILKRSLDIVASAAGLVMLSPVLLLVSLLVRLSGPGPIMFKQVRVGQGNKPFTVLKFRTMVAGAERDQASVWAAAAADGTVNKSRNDPRITPVGRWLRRASIDELPQLLNVLAGSMSLVGPRPLQPVEVEDMKDFEDRRHLGKPGLTGLWQISGRNETSWEQRMRLDAYYVENWSPALDLVILVRTLRVVLSGSGAY